MNKVWRFRGHVFILDDEPPTELEATQPAYVCEACRLRVPITEYLSLPTMKRLMIEGASRRVRDMAAERFNRILPCAGDPGTLT